MKTPFKFLQPALIAILLTITATNLSAAPPQTGILVRTYYNQPGSAVEIAPGVWVGDAGFSVPAAESFTVMSAHSRRQIGHYASDSTGVLEISLSPGDYIIVPLGCGVITEPFGVSVRPKQITEAVIYFGPCVSSSAAFP